MLFISFISQFSNEETMMDTIIERSTYVQAFQQQLNDELARVQLWPWRAPSPAKAATRKVVLRDGAAVGLRPARPDDLRPLWEMYRRVSAASLYYRYLHAYKPLPADLAQICDINDEVGGALVATAGRFRKQIVAVAYYLKEKQRADTAGVAILVEDRFQGRGLGQILLQHLSQYGRERGVATFDAAVHPANAAMLRVIHNSGLPFTKEVSYDLEEIQIQLTPVVPGPGAA